MYPSGLVGGGSDMGLVLTLYYYYCSLSSLLSAVVSAFFPNHVQTEDKRTKAVHLLVGFRSYLHYHIKCSKTYLHMRMRSRVDSLLKGK